MNKTIQPARDRERDIMNRAASVMAMTVDPTTDAAGNMIADNAVMMENLDKAVQKVPMFEGVPPEAARQIAGGWAMSLHEYKRQNGHYPASDVLANAHRALERLMTECASNTHEGSGKAMFESVAESMRTSDGVMKVAQYAALILPASLGAATSDACTFVPCERDESHIYELLNVAGTKFGSFQQGDELDMQSAGVYSQMKRLYTLTEKGDNSKTTFTFDIKKFEGQACPIRQGYNKLLINRKPSKVDDGDGNLYFNDRDTKGNAFSATAKVKYDTGVIDITFTDAPAEGTEIAVQVEINVERNPGLIPVINQAMRKYTVRPSQYVIASEHTVMAASDLSREHGLELAALQFSAMRNWISHETDIMRLRTLVFHTVYGREFDVALPEAQSYESWVGLLRHAVNALSQDMANRTKTTGIRGGFAVLMRLTSCVLCRRNTSRSHRAMSSPHTCSTSAHCLALSVSTKCRNLSANSSGSRAMSSAWMTFSSTVAAKASAKLA